MRNKILIFVLFVSFSMVSCKTKTDNTSETGSDFQEFTIVASNYPLLYFAQRLAGELASMKFPASVSTDPAYWQPRSEDITAMQQADFILLNGATYEKWIDKVSLPASKVINTTAGLEEQFIALEGTMTHSHGPEGEHEHGETGMTTWLDLSLAIEQAKVVRDALLSAFPEEESYINEAFNGLKADLDGLDGEINQLTTSNHNLYAVFSHPVYQYFQHRYHLHGTSLHWEPDLMPDEQQWKELEQILSAHPGAVMVWEDIPSEEIGSKLKAMGIVYAVFNPCGNRPEEGDLISVMKANLESLRKLY